MKRFGGSLPWVVGVVTGLALGWWGYAALVFEERVPAVPFSHAVHTGEAVGMTCDDCHRTSNVRAISLPTVDDCTACHMDFPGIDRDLEELLALSEPWPSSLEQPEGVRFSHAQHVDLAGMECSVCHGDHGTSTSAGSVAVNRISGYPRALWGRDGVGPAGGAHAMEMSDCVGCHEQRGVVQSCLDCHR